MTGRSLFAEPVVVQTDAPGCPGTRRRQDTRHRWSPRARALSHSEKPWARCVPSQACVLVTHSVAEYDRAGTGFRRSSQRVEIVGISKRFGGIWSPRPNNRVIIGSPETTQESTLDWRHAWVLTTPIVVNS